MGGLDDPYVELVDEHDDVGSGVDPPDADVVELAVHAEGDRPGLVDSVSTHPIVARDVPAPGPVLGRAR